MHCFSKWVRKSLCQREIDTSSTIQKPLENLFGHLGKNQVAMPSWLYGQVIGSTEDQCLFKKKKNSKKWLKDLRFIAQTT